MPSTSSSRLMKRGALVVLEGVDRSGKSTQCKMLKDTLNNQGHSVELFRFPERSTAIGKVIADYLAKKCELDDHAVHLLFSANRWELMPDLKKHIENGTTVIVDRYAYSGAAFTAAKPGFSLDWCKQADVGLPRPDLVLFLTLTPEQAARRGGFGDERYEQTDFQKRVAANYSKLSGEDNWKMIDADKDIDTLHTELTQLITSTIAATKSSGLGTLWTPASDCSGSPVKEKTRLGQEEALV
ncbi:thymidylate kinase-like [Watersipora subatra]|uniref:thymidylate kinase-like n=1 Tax=Watersipora subatra TaxID=2589382 RepID=UPI00355BBF0B